MGVILITGTSSGIGLLTAARLSAAGHIVYASMRNLAKQGDLQLELDRRKTSATIVTLDVTDNTTIDQAIQQISTEAGRLDVLINNAGFGMGGFFEDLTEDEIRAQMETNFFGVQAVTRYALPLMRASASQGPGGKIINISSIQGQLAFPGLGAYTASKFALEGFSEGLSFELQPFNIRVVLVEPGSYFTKIFTENARIAVGAEKTGSPYNVYAKIIRGQIDKMIADPRRIGDPEDVAVLIEKIVEKKKPGLRYAIGDRAIKILRLKKLLPRNWFHAWQGRLMRTKRR